MNKLKTIGFTLLAFVLSSTPVLAVQLTNPLGEGVVDPRVIIGRIIGALLGIVGSVALVIFIYGGVQILISTGNSERVKKGRDTMIWAAIGLAIIFTSYAITQYVIQALTGAGAATPPTP